MFYITLIDWDLLLIWDFSKKTSIDHSKIFWKYLLTETALNWLERGNFVFPPVVLGSLLLFVVRHALGIFSFWGDRLNSGFQVVRTSSLPGTVKWGLRMHSLLLGSSDTATHPMPIRSRNEWKNRCRICHQDRKIMVARQEIYLGEKVCRVIVFTPLSCL